MTYEQETSRAGLFRRAPGAHCSRQPIGDSWYRSWSDRALDTLDELDLPRHAAILDLGDGHGDGRVTAGLLARGFSDVTVLDPSPAAGPGGLGTWRPARTFDVWHDRAWLQFRLPGRGWQPYLDALRRGTHPGSLAVLSSFTPASFTPASFTPAGDRPVRSPMRLASDDLALLLGAQFARVTHRDDTYLSTDGLDEGFQWSVFERLH